MASDSLMPRKKSGGAGFVVAAVVMLCASGGLIYWKLSHKAQPNAPVVESVRSVAQAPKPEVFDEPPPPPPPPVVPTKDAGEPEKKATASRVGSGGFGCSGECTGTATGPLTGALQGRAGQSRGCYERALRNNSTLQGRLVMSVTVGPEGQVCNAGIAENTLGDPAVATCVLQMFRGGGTLPRPKGGCVNVNVPISFVPKT